MGWVLDADIRGFFDSIDHDFILAVLEQIDMPAWIMNVVGALLTDVSVRLAIWKQGCPLSPLLFVLCYDLICSMLAPFGMADDLAVLPEDMTGLVGALQGQEVRLSLRPGTEQGQNCGPHIP